jgi:hypothetical protein
VKSPLRLSNRPGEGCGTFVSDDARVRYQLEIGTRDPCSSDSGKISSAAPHILLELVAKTRVLVGGPVQYQAYQQYRASHNLPAENPPPVYRGPASTFDWRK